MSNLSDKDIDRLSREAADSYEPDHSSLSWSRLEQKLIEQIPERPPDGFRFGRINPFVWGSAVVVMACLSILTIKNFKYNQYSTRVSQHKADTIKDGNNINNPKSGVTAIRLDSLSLGRAVVPADKINSSDGITADKSNTKQTIYTKSGSGTNLNSKFSHDNSGKKSTLNKQHISGIASAVYIGNKASNNYNKVKTETISGENNQKKPVGSQSENDLFNPSDAAVNTAHDPVKYSLPVIATMANAPGIVKGNDSLLNRPDQTQKAVPYKSLRVNRSLNVGITFGPDYTDAGGITNNQLGNNIGLTLGYYLTNKLSVNTGILYSNKFFWAPGPKSSNNSGGIRTAAAPPPIEYINGSANLWEIPLTLRYDFAQNEKTRFFFNAGLSSYFVMKQTYINLFYSGQRLLAYRTFDDQQVNYWFKVADISFGFETDLGKGFSFQGEPFLKFPLVHMGAENLKLNSYGFLLSFKYSPVLSRTKK